MERKSVLRSVTGAITCVAAGNFASPAFSKAVTLPCSSSAGTMGRNGGQPCQHVTRVAKLSELGAAGCSRCEESLPW
jgi:hypothetical protein